MPVYFIRPIGMRGPVKIGCSGLPPSRLSTLMTWSPFPLEIVVAVEGDSSLERRLHGIFAASHTHREWFKQSGELEALIGELQRGRPIGDCIDLNAPLLPFREKTTSYMTDEWRRRNSYTHRLRWAFDKHRKAGGKNWIQPDDTRLILRRWSHDDQMPTDAEFQRLESVISDPATHGEIPNWEIAA